MSVLIHLNVLSQAYLGTGYAHSGKEVGVASLAGLASQIWAFPPLNFGNPNTNFFRLQVLKPLVVDMVYLLMPQVDIRLDFLSFRKHSGAYVMLTVSWEHLRYDHRLSVSREVLREGFYTEKALRDRPPCKDH